MKKLLGGASALALLLGLSAQGIAAEVTILGGSVTNADAISANAEFQDTTNDVIVGDDLVDDQALYDGEMLFGDTTFQDQDVDVNNFNTGINGSQQGGIAVAVVNDNDCNCGAVSINWLDQEADNSIDVDDDGLDDDGIYDGTMHFGVNTFRHQDVAVNNFNSGWNAAQQGGIAITGATGTLTTP